MKQFRVFAIVGKSGCGKGTQVELLQKKIPGLVHITSSDLLKQFVKKGGPFARRVDETMKRGDAVPSSLVIELWMDVLLDLPRRATGIVWEGSPRSLLEAQIMDDAVPFTTGATPIPVYLHVSDAEVRTRLLKRLQCVKCKELVPYRLLASHPKTCSYCGGKLVKRSDDNPKAISERLAFFRKQVVPALDWYKKQNRLIVVNGQQDVNQVFDEFWKKLKQRKLV